MSTYKPPVDYEVILQEFERTHQIFKNAVKFMKINAKPEEKNYFAVMKQLDRVIEQHDEAIARLNDKEALSEIDNVNSIYEVPEYLEEI